jgi:hypothetical protein
MAYNSNQFFYAALYWTAALSGAAPEVIGNICAEHGMEPPQAGPQMGLTPAPAGESQATPAQQRVFFESLFGALTSGKVEQEYYASGRPYIDLSASERDRSYGKIYDGSAAIVAAGMAAELKWPAIPFTTLHLQDDGQIIQADIKDGRLQSASLDYPGRPVLPYHLAEIPGEVFDAAPKVTWETLHRVVPLEEGQAARWVYEGVSGKRVEFNKVAGAHDVAAVNLSGIESGFGFDAVSDADIVMGTGKVTRNRIGDAASYAPGFDSDAYNLRIEATDRPNIVREVSRPYDCLDVAAPVQLGYHSNYAIAWPGDKIVRQDADSAPRVVKQEYLSTGIVTLRPVRGGPGGA